MTRLYNAERLTTPTGAQPGIQRIRSFLMSDPFAAAYMLGNLDPIYAPFSAWWMATEAGQDVALLQVYSGLSVPVVITHGEPEAIDAILEAFIQEIPHRSIVHMHPNHLGILDHYFTLDHIRPMVRMGLRREDFKAHDLEAAPAPGYSAVSRLSHRDTGDIMALSVHYPDAFFEPHQLSTGHYYGIRSVAGELVAIAGVHTINRTDGLATIGNIVTHPEHRGKGLSTKVTSQLCRELMDDDIGLFALNVERRNSSAMHIYEKLGFAENCTYIEAFLTRTLDDELGHSADSAVS